MNRRLRSVLQAVCIWTLALMLGVSIFTYPWFWVIDQRVKRIGTSKIVTDFDEWRRGSTQTGKIPIDTLPSSIAALKPKRAVKREDGLYLVLKAYFVQETGIFIEDLGAAEPRARNTDPAFVPLGPRVYRYRVKG